MLVEGDLGPAAELVGLIREAGIEVREADGYGAGRMVLPGGGTLCLTDGRLPVSKDQVHFDLALDYRAATRIALSASEGVRTGLLSEATGLFQALGKEVSVVGDVPGRSWPGPSPGSSTWRSTPWPRAWPPLRTSTRRCAWV
ncbi:hypothetical protein SVIOM342S_03617 [Streptomyces violaceorubidus]